VGGLVKYQDSVHENGLGTNPTGCGHRGVVLLVAGAQIILTLWSLCIQYFLHNV